MVKPPRRQLIILGVLVAAAGLLLWLQSGLGPGAPSAAGGDAGDSGQALPRIDLARLGAQKDKAAVGKRDLFDFGSVAVAQAQATPEPTPTPDPEEDPFGDAPSPTPAPFMNVKYVGSVSDKRGLKVAVLMTDRKELLTGQAGELVANRFRIVNIGLESVDIQDVGSGNVRRIPLRAN
jgi:hypothetical protein